MFFSITTANIGGFLRPGTLIDVYKHRLQQDCDIICLQEFSIPNAKTTKKNFVSRKWQAIKNRWRIRKTPMKLATSFGQNFGNAILSKFKLSPSETQFLPINFGPAAEPIGLVQYTQINMAGYEHKLIIYNCHLPASYWGIGKRLNFFETLLKTNQKKHDNQPVIICGDLNTLYPKPGFKRYFMRFWHQTPWSNTQEDDGYKLSEQEHFHNVASQFGFKSAFAFSTPTWQFPGLPQYFFSTQLDWIFFKNLDLISTKIKPFVFDHRPLQAFFKLV